MDDKNMYFTFTTECAKENVNEVIKTVAEYIDNLRKTGFTQVQLDKTKRMIKYGEHENEPRVTDNFYKLYDFRGHGKVLNYKKLKNIRRKLTLEEVNNIFNETIDSARVSATIYGDIKKSELIKEKEFNNLFNKK